MLAVGSDAVQCDVSAAIATMVEDVHQRRALLSDMNSVSAIVGLLSSPNLTADFFPKGGAALNYYTPWSATGVAGQNVQQTLKLSPRQACYG